MEGRELIEGEREGESKGGKVRGQNGEEMENRRRTGGGREGR